MRVPRALWLLAPLVVGAGLLLLLLRGGSRPEVPAAPLEELPSSNLSVRVAYGLAGLADELEVGLPSRFGSLGSRLRYPGDERLEYAFEAERGPLALSSVADTVRVVTELRYGGQVWYATPLGVELTTSCGIDAGELAGTAPRAAIQLSFPLVVDENWTVRSVPSVDVVEPASSSDRCLAAVLGFEVDATDAIMLSLRERLEEEAARVGAQIEAVSPRTYAEEWWAAAQAPIEVASDVWLVLEPEALSYRIGDATGPAIAGEIGATVRPRLVVGPRPTTSVRALPPLAAAAQGADNPAEWVDVEAMIDFAEASEIVGASLVGAAWQGLGRAVRVSSTELSGDGEGRVALTLELEGDVPARVRLVGTPAFDAATEELTVPDLDVTLESGGLLPRVLVGAARLFPGILRRRARIPLERLVPGGLDERIELRLSDDATLDASLTELEITAAVTTEEGILLRARIRPDATLRVD